MARVHTGEVHRQPGGSGQAQATTHHDVLLGNWRAVQPEAGRRPLLAQRVEFDLVNPGLRPEAEPSGGVAGDDGVGVPQHQGGAAHLEVLSCLRVGVDPGEQARHHATGGQPRQRAGAPGMVPGTDHRVTEQFTDHVCAAHATVMGAGDVERSVLHR